MSDKPEFPPYYYLHQVLLAVGGIVLAFVINFTIIEPDSAGKPSAWLLVLGPVIPLTLVNIHRIVVTRRLKILPSLPKQTSTGQPHD